MVSLEVNYCYHSSKEFIYEQFLLMDFIQNEFQDLLHRIEFWKNCDRIGPDIPWTHWRLYFKSTMKDLCTRKFKHFGEHAEFRPGAYAECCSKFNW